MTENLFGILDQFFGDLNFKKKKRLWYRKENDGFIVCQFQRFRFDVNGSGFLNFGIVFVTNGKKTRVPGGEETWDLRSRYKNIIGDAYNDEIFPIDLMNDNDKEKVKAALVSIKAIVIPYLTRYSELKNLIGDLRDKKFDYARALTSIQG